MDRASQDAEHSFQLECTVGGLDSRFPIQPGETSIGSPPENGLVLSESGVSRTHASVKLRDGRLSITDSDSKNGVYVNRAKIPDAELAVGDEIHLGPVLLTLTTEALERRLIQKALRQSEGNRTQAAKLLGITRNGLAMKVKRLALDCE